MPQIIPAIVGFLAANAPAIGAASAIAGAGTSIGEAIANRGGPATPTTPTAPTAPTPTPPNLNQLLQERQLVGSQASNLESATSGAAGPDFLKLFAPFLAGISGQPGASGAGTYAANQAWAPANSQPTNAAVQGQPVNLSDFISSNT
jgi:hypothetical protein